MTCAAEALTHKAVERALAGDGLALRLCLERMLPPRKERPIDLELPPLTGARDVLAASAALVAAVAAGEVAPGEERELGRLLEPHLRALELQPGHGRAGARGRRGGPSGPGAQLDNRGAGLYIR